jgi:hypothetical protein
VSSSNDDIRIGYNKQNGIEISNSYTWNNTTFSSNSGQKFLSITLSITPRDFNQSVVIKSAELWDVSGKKYYPIESRITEFTYSSNSVRFGRSYSMFIIYDIPVSSNPKSIDFSYYIKDDEETGSSSLQTISLSIFV